MFEGKLCTVVAQIWIMFSLKLNKTDCDCQKVAAHILYFGGYNEDFSSSTMSMTG